MHCYWSCHHFNLKSIYSRHLPLLLLLVLRPFGVPGHTSTRFPAKPFSIRNKAFLVPFPLLPKSPHSRSNRSRRSEAPPSVNPFWHSDHEFISTISYLSIHLIWPLIFNKAENPLHTYPCVSSGRRITFALRPPQLPLKFSRFQNA